MLGLVVWVVTARKEGEIDEYVVLECDLQVLRSRVGEQPLLCIGLGNPVLRESVWPALYLESELIDCVEDDLGTVLDWLDELVPTPLILQDGENTGVLPGAECCSAPFTASYSGSTPAVSPPTSPQLMQAGALRILLLFGVMRKNCPRIARASPN